ncbi:ABC1 kinase family protein [Peptostreptococcus faecalis]|uniref:ABC1 kinase family protein n=1 Tax=Peptostreptococcus faecalis TaxID=2045015 RepID=UPI000C79D5EC|nr:AarF/UbiB family protein [Peptostreptococcus faecalis]
MKIGYRYIGRYTEIASVMIKYGFGFIIEKLNKDTAVNKVPNSVNSGEYKNLTTGERLRLAFEELGPTYIKIGQIISTRKDLFDDDIIFELSKLRDQVEEFDTDEAMSILENELNAKKDTVFKKISATPIAAASIGQVYDAELLNGKRVVVKIQRPGIEKIIRADISILKKVAGKFTFLKTEYNIDAVEFISELEVQLIRELDYKFEAVNGIKLKKIFKYNGDVFIPEIYNDYTTKKILIMEKVNGIALSDIGNHDFTETEKKKIVDIGVRSFFKQVMEHGFFHADPHPGNIFIMEGNKLAYIDFGMMGLIDDKTLGYLNQLIMFSTDKNIEKIIRVLSDMEAISSEADNAGLRRDLLYLIHYYYDIPFDKLSIAEVLNEIFRFMRTHKIKLPSQIVLLGKTVITLEGTSRGLYRDFNVDIIIKSYIKFYREEKLNLKKNARVLKSNLFEAYYDVSTVPMQIKNILKKMEKSNLKIDIEKLSVPSLEESIRKFSAQLSLSIIFAACILGSSLMISSQNVNSNKIMQIISLGGFAFSFLIGIILIIMILKNSKSNRK